MHDTTQQTSRLENSDAHNRDADMQLILGNVEHFLQKVPTSTFTLRIQVNEQIIGKGKLAS